MYLNSKTLCGLDLPYKIGVLLIFVWFIVSPLASASIENVRFEHYYVEQGLSQQVITDIHQDEKGFIWVGTQEGLNRFDGRRFTQYLQSFESDNALASSYVNTITSDNDGFVWIGTNKGLSRLDPNTGNFTNYFSGENQSGLNGSLINKLWKDRNGVIWAATRFGINKYLASENRFQPFNIADSEGDSVNIKVITEDLTGMLWLGSSSNGVYRFDPTLERFSVAFQSLPSESGPIVSSVKALYFDTEQKLWIGTAKAGTFVLDLASQQDADLQSSVKIVPELEYYNAEEIIQDSNGVMWFGAPLGLAYIDADGHFGAFEHEQDDFYSLSDTGVTALLQDSADVIWAGTFKGLNKWNTSTAQFDHFRASSRDKIGLSGNIITAVTGLDEHHLVIANFEGTDIVDIRDNSSKPIILPKEDGVTKDDYEVMSLASTGSNEIWLGTRANGLYLYDIKAKRFTHYRADKNALPANARLNSNAITSIYPTSKNTIWVTTFGGGISKIDREKNEIETYRYDPDDVFTLSGDNVMSITASRDGTFWLGTATKGITVFNPQTASAFRIRADREDTSGLISEFIWDIHEDKNNNIWVATQEAGLHLLTAENRDKADIRFTRLTKSDGLPSDVIFGILEDEEGFIWVSSNRGLSKIDPQTLNLTNFTYAQGLQSDEFNSGSFYQAPDGMMAFGGQNGVTTFYPKEVKLNQHLPKTIITGFQRLDSVTPIALALNESEQIVADYTDYLIGFEFAALHFTAPEKNLFKYRLSGFEDDWIDVRDVPRAIYTSLPAGDYRFEVIAANSDGVWNMEPAFVDLKVKPAPWASLYAYVFYAAVTMLLLFMIYRSYQNKLEAETKYRQALEVEVNKRTQELSAANEKLLKASVTDQLTGLYNRRYLVEAIEGRSKRIYKRFMTNLERGKINHDSGPRIFFLMFDLDGFKPINDTYGHDAGDKMIQQVARILEDVCRVKDTVIRWGGDEFLVFGEVNKLEEIAALAERIRDKIQKHGFDIGIAQKMHLSSSIGFAMYPFSHHAPDSMSWEQAHILADNALYKSKECGKNRWTGIIQAEEPVPFTRMNSLIQNINLAIDEKHVRVVST